MKVIVADDDPLFQRLLTRSLSRWDFTTEVAPDGQYALDVLLQATDPCIALLDWVMPGLEGPEVCRRLRADSRPHAVHLILLTGRGSRDDIVAGLQAGADDYMVKPFDQQELYARLQVGVRALTLQQSLASRVQELADALTRVKQLQGLLPICCYCKSVRTDDNYWQKVEHYFAQHTEVQFSHGICPRCYQDVVEPELQRFKEERNTTVGS
jgi:DNA-binding response OmpR family regulator